MDWTELPEVRIVKDDVLPHMMRTLLDCEYTDRMARKEKFKEEYHRLTTSQQWALGYMLCLMASSRLSRFDPYTGAETDLFSRFRPSFLRLPLRFLGYPGAHNATGIAYGLDPTYFYD